MDGLIHHEIVWTQPEEIKEETTPIEIETCRKTLEIIYQQIFRTSMGNFKELMQGGAPGSRYLSLTGAMAIESSTPRGFALRSALRALNNILAEKTRKIYSDRSINIDLLIWKAEKCLGNL